MLFAVILLVSAIIIGGAVLFRRYHKQKSPAVRTLSAVMPTINPERELRKLIATHADILKLYEDIGYSPFIQWEIDQLISNLKNLIVVRIPDFPAFKTAIRQIVNQMESGIETTGMTPELILYIQNHPFFQEILEHLEDSDAILRLLNRDPYRELIPMLEEIPMLRAGKTVWKTPLELRIITKQPYSRDDFLKIIDAIESQVTEAKIIRKAEVKRAILELIQKIKKDIMNEYAYMITSVSMLENRIQEWLWRADLPDASNKKKQLDQFLLELINLRRVDTIEALRQWTTIALQEYKKTVLELAQKFLSISWMHTPTQINWLIIYLMNTEIAGLLKLKHPKEGLTQRLISVRQEIRESYFDPEEIIRRLHQLEADNYYMNSIVFALLRQAKPISYR